MFAVVLDAAADLQQATTVMQTALRAVDEVLSDPAPQVMVSDVGVGTVTLECRAWTAPDRAGQAAARDAAITAVLRAVAAQRVALAADTVLLREVDESHGDGGCR